VVIDHRRRAWLRRWVPGLVPDVPAPGAESRAERDNLAAAVREALEDMPAELREVIVLCELEERNGAEVAELLGVPLGTVKSRLRRARERFEAEARRRGLAPDAPALGRVNG
jgi:RNA polymerase sigma-70 factor (ECF subfamily)